MPKDKQKKKKEREKRVAQKKHAATLKRIQAQAATDSKAAGPKTKKVFQPETAPKTSYVATVNKSNFIQRRSGS